VVLELISDAMPKSDLKAETFISDKLLKDIAISTDENKVV
jgi:hypothetical protein